ncbi:hypothetical protein ACLIYP_06055 [Streptomyces nanhaiensis]|uniref:hypothetical protein n=1 Tax=Streptomyces nanhaiensis TaxID=679319 RepID=UPI00399CE9EE
MPSAPRAASQPPARNPFQAPDFGDLPDYDEAEETGEPPFDADAAADAAGTARAAKDEGPARNGGGKRPSNSPPRRRDRSRQVRRGSSRR